MDDLIRRQEILTFIEKSVSEYGNRYSVDMLNMWGLFAQVVKDMPSAQQWIPCSERLPDSQEDVLCDEDGHVILGFYTDEEIGWHDTHSYRIYPTAWMPLPSPYREETES